MDGFRYTFPVEVRFGDIDGMGHVNNAVFATYYEIGRTRYYRDVVGARDLESIDFILARLEIDFVEPILLEDVVSLGLRVSSIGSTSFGFEYLLTRNGRVAGRGRSVQVFYDYATRGKKPVPGSFVAKVSAFEGREFPRG